MLKIEADCIINDLVRNNLQGKGHRDAALYFHLDCSISSYEDSEKFSERMGLHLLYWCPPGISYISVFAAQMENPFHSRKEVREWKHLITHDSCWAQTRFFSENYFAMAKLVNEQRVRAGLQEIAPRVMTQLNRFHRESIALWVPVMVGKDPNCDRNYRLTLTILE
jgi:hypothetical protein